MRYGADSQCGPGAELCFVTVLVVLGRDQKFTFKQLYVRWEPFSLTLTITRLFDPSGALEVRFLTCSEVLYSDQIVELGVTSYKVNHSLASLPLE